MWSFLTLLVATVILRVSFRTFSDFLNALASLQILITPPFEILRRDVVFRTISSRSRSWRLECEFCSRVAECKNDSIVSRASRKRCGYGELARGTISRSSISRITDVSSAYVTGRGFGSRGSWRIPPVYLVRCLSALFCALIRLPLYWRLFF